MELAGIGTRAAALGKVDTMPVCCCSEDPLEEDSLDAAYAEAHSGAGEALEAEESAY